MINIIRLVILKTVASTLVLILRKRKGMSEAKERLFMALIASLLLSVSYSPPSHRINALKSLQYITVFLQNISICWLEMGNRRPLLSPS